MSHIAKYYLEEFPTGMSKEEQREKNSANYYQVNWKNLKGNKYFL